MSARAGAVLGDFKTIIEALAPTDIAPGRRFLWADDDRLHADQAAGMTRSFNVKWAGRTTEDVQDLAQQYASHVFLLSVAYSRQYELLKRQQIMLSDAFDLIKELRDPAHFITDCDTRELVRDEQIEQGQNVYLRQQWRCVIREEE